MPHATPTPPPPRSHVSHVSLASRLAVLLALTLAPACDDKSEVPAHKRRAKPDATIAAGEAAPAGGKGVSAAALMERARPLLAAVPPQADNPNNPLTEPKVELGRLLYFDPRLSKNHDISCNTCHDLAQYGVDVRERDGARARTSAGHRGAVGERNSPTVYHAAFAIAQFWDGRATDVEDQAGKPILNPVEMAMPDEAAVLRVLRSIPGYAPKFAAAFPGDAEPITYANMAAAIGAFERKLVTPSPFDRFMQGDLTALDQAQLAGLELFLDVGCTQCHTGPAIGGTQFQKLGSIKPWPNLVDEGRGAVTKSPLDRFMFKVPTLRNVAKTGPWLHDGSIDRLETVVAMMAEHQAARGKTTPAESTAIVAFLGALTGELPQAYIAPPTLPESGPDTPKPDPS